MSHWVWRDSRREPEEQGLPGVRRLGGGKHVSERETHGPTVNRWLLFALLTIAGILALVDRQIISVLKPTIAGELGWSDNDYGTLGASFQGATAIALLFTGPIADRLGVKWANAFGVFTWSVAAMFHGWARSLMEFTICRIALGATEALAAPTNIKTIAVIFPPNMRTMGFGLSNAVASLGAICAPLFIPIIALAIGWRGAFVAAGAAGIVWAAVWVLVTRKIRFNDAVTAVAPGAAGAGPSIFRERATWAVAGAKTLSDMTWWLMLFWMPDFMHRQFGLTGVAIGPPLALAYAGAAAGALLSGGLASQFLIKGYPVNRVRKLAMLISGLLVLPLPLALYAPTAWAAAGILALVLFAHQGFSTNLFALITDVTDRRKIGRVTSFATFCGNIGGMGIVKAAGMFLAAGLGYMPLFLFAAVSYLLALGWIQLWLPRIERIASSDDQPVLAAAH